MIAQLSRVHHIIMKWCQPQLPMPPEARLEAPAFGVERLHRAPLAEVSCSKEP